MRRTREETVLLWRARKRVSGRSSELRCTMEQLGESCFELRMLRGQELVVLESFEDPATLLLRSEQLRTGLEATA